MACKSALKDNLTRVRERIAAAAARSGRRADQVRLVVVTKGVPDDTVRQIIEMGETDLGESRVQDLQTRVEAVTGYLVRTSPSVPPDVRWHMIGHLQRNKVRPLLPLVHMIHSVDTLRLAETIDQMAGRIGKKVRVLLEVNCSGEPQKYGVSVGAINCLVEQLATLSHLELCGVMTMAPLVDDAEEARPVFARMREVFQDILAERRAGPAFRELSMGMSQDFEAAIEEGATLVRIGTAIFGGV